MHGGKISMELGEKAGEKRRAIVGIGLVLGGGERGKEDGPEESSSRGGGRGVKSRRDDSGPGKREKGAKKENVGGCWKRSGDQWAAASFGGARVCVCVRAYQARKGHEATLPPVRSSWAASPTPRISGENP